MSQFSKFAVFGSPFIRLLLCFLASQPAMLSSAAETLDFHRDVQPILAGHCIECHGPDAAARKGKIMHADPEERMPPAEFAEKKPLQPQQVETLKRWIAEGAKFEKHWAFATPVKRAVPEPGGWGHNEIDRFVHARMKAAGMQPQTAASKEKIMRRVSFDLTGLPPTLAEVESFLLDKSGDAYGKVVDRLLESPRFGERWAVWWLDGAHYGDSHGYDNDLENSQWPWRNWVIDAFNANKPFNEFTIEQLAGDLLPNATEDQILATAFNRNHRIQTEDGAIDEEWRAEYVMDRVETMGSVWMGLTLGCARCHDHKYDPVSQKEFFQLFALFNNLDEKGFVNNLSGAAEPRMRYREAGFAQQAREIEERHKGKEWEQERKKLEEQFPHVMIMREMGSPRKAFVLKRGQYDAPGEEVKAALPHAFSPAPGGNVTRLDLARWLVDGRHPLTARVVVNRLWEQLFGAGLVKGSENLGTQAGPSGWVYQPDGLWQEVEKRGTFVQDRGEKLYRRSLYSRIRKTVAPPSMLLFDMPSREMCTVKRTQTNTPLQALALLNEVTYVEAAKKFAERMLKEGGSARERIAWGFRTATARAATAEELAVLLAGFERRLARFREDPKGAENLLSHGDSKVADGADKVELAALTTVANVLLNLDEMINK